MLSQYNNDDLPRCGDRIRRLKYATDPSPKSPYDDDDYSSTDEGSSKYCFTPEEERYLEAMHFQRTRDMLRSRSAKFVHKFSVACPAHIVATTICSFYVIFMMIEGGVVFNAFEKFKTLDTKVAAIEGILNMTLNQQHVERDTRFTYTTLMNDTNNTTHNTRPLLSLLELSVKTGGGGGAGAGVEERRSSLGVRIHA